MGKKVWTRANAKTKQKAVEVVEMDELHTYVGSKKNDRCVWIAVDRCTKRLIAFVCGDRSTQNCEMYLEGLESRAIGRLLEISYGTVYKWVRKSGQEQMLRQSKEAVEVVEMDELHTYVGSKKTTDVSGLLLIDVQKG